MLLLLLAQYANEIDVSLSWKPSGRQPGGRCRARVVAWLSSPLFAGAEHLFLSRSLSNFYRPFWHVKLTRHVRPTSEEDEESKRTSELAQSAVSPSSSEGWRDRARVA